MEGEGVRLLARRRPWVGGCPVRGRSLCAGGAPWSMGGASSSVGDPGHACVHGGTRPWVGPLLCPCTLSVVGAGWSFCLWATTVVACGCWMSFMGTQLLSMGTGSLFVGPGLLIIGSGARSCGRIVHGCWFVVHGCGGDVWCAGWGVVAYAGWCGMCWVGDVTCTGWSSLARLDRMREGVLTKQQQ